MSTVDRAPLTAARRSWIYRRRYVPGALLVAAAVVLAGLSEPSVTPYGGLDALLLVVGWVVFGVGAGLRFWATLHIGGRKRSTLVTTGPYARCRNPLYLASTLLAVSAAFFLGSWVVLLGVLAALGACLLGPIRAEERDLRQIHGAAFDAYVRAVPRFLPRRARTPSEPTIEVRAHGLALEVRRCLIWGWIPLAARALVQLRLQPWWPTPLHWG